MKKLIEKIYMYFKGREMWNAKMSEHLKITIISTPQKQYYIKRLTKQLFQDNIQLYQF